MFAASSKVVILIKPKSKYSNKQTFQSISFIADKLHPYKKPSYLERVHIQ